MINCHRERARRALSYHQQRHMTGTLQSMSGEQTLPVIWIAELVFRRRDALNDEGTWQLLCAAHLREIDKMLLLWLEYPPTENTYIESDEVNPVY